MLSIDGMGLGVNWQRFLSDTLDPVVAPPPPPQKDDSSAGPANPTVAPPIPVTATPFTDPSKPTNAEIASATSLIQSMAAQYAPPPPDITVDNDKTEAVQKAIQDAQTQYDNASQSLQGAQNALRLANRDPESTPDERNAAQANYAKARAAADSAQRTLNVTTDAGYMILYGEQATNDMPAGMVQSDTGEVTNPGDAQNLADQKLAALQGLFPDYPHDPNDKNWAPQASDCKTPIQIRAYDDWQTADAQAAAGAAKYYADISNSNLAYTQFQSYLADPDYKAAVDAGVGKLNDALAPQNLEVSLPDAPASIDAAQQAVTAAAKDANYANAALSAANDNLTLVQAQQQSDADNGKEGPTVLVPGALAKDKTALARAQTAAGTSSSYLQMLSTQQQADTLQANFRGEHARIDDDPSDPYTQLQMAKQQASIAHDAFVVAYGGSLAQQYDDQAAQVEAAVKAAAKSPALCRVQPNPLNAPLNAPLFAAPWSTAANGAANLPGAAPPSASLFSAANPAGNLLVNGTPIGYPPSLDTSPFVTNPLQPAQSDATASDTAAGGPTLADAQRLRVVAGAVRAADDRLSDSVNERATNAALAQARNQQSQKHDTLTTVQQQYDDWQASHPAPTRFRQVADGDIMPAYTPPLPNPNQSQLDQAKQDVQNADNTVQRLQLMGELAHRQVLMDEFDAGLDERLRYVTDDHSDEYKDYEKAARDFYSAHHADMSNTLLDVASANTGNGATIDFGKLSDTQQRNLIGVALGMSPDVGGDPSSTTSVANDTQTHFTDKDKLSAIDGVRNTLLKIGGGAGTQINVLPIVYAAKDVGTQTTALFEVKDTQGVTHFVDETAATYRDINDYIDNNQLSSDGTVDIATGHNADGTLQIMSRAAHHDSGFDSFLNTLTGTKLNLGMLIGGMVLEGIGGVLDATVLGLPLGATLNVIGTGMTYTSIAATMTSSALDLENRADHGLGTNPFTDAGARSDAINLIPMGAEGASKLVGSKLFMRGFTGLTRMPRVASFLRTGTKVFAVGTGAIGATESFFEAGADYLSGHADAGNKALVGGLTNLALIGGGKLKERTVTGVVNRTGIVARTTDGKAVTIDGQTIRQLLNNGGDASLAAGRNRATFDGERVTVSHDGTLMVGDNLLTYDGKPIRMLDNTSRKALPAGESVVLGADGKLSLASVSDKDWTHGTRIDSLTDTGESLSFGPGGRMSTTPKIAARTRLDLLDSALQQARDAYTAETGGEQTARSLAQTTTEDETASAATDARSTRRTSEERARIDEQRDESDADHATNAGSDRRSADAHAMRYRPLDTDTPSGAGIRETPGAARPRVDVRVVDLADEPAATRPATSDPAGIAVPRGPRAEPMKIGDRTVYVVRDGAEADAPAVGGIRPQDLEEPVVVVAGEHDGLLAPELANRWQKAIYAAAPDAFGTHGQLRTDARVLRFDPAPEANAPAAVAGEAASDETPHASSPRNPGDDTVIVLAGKRGPNEPAVPNPMTTRQPVNALGGRFSPPNRILVLVRPERTDAPERAPARDGTAPDESRADGAKPRSATASDAAALPDTYLEAAHPELTEAAPPDAAAPDHPGRFPQVQLRFGGGPLPEAAQALAMQSATLVTQLRMLHDAGWRVKLGKRGGGSYIDPRKRRITIDSALQDPGSITYTLAGEARQAVEAMHGVLKPDYGDRGRFTRKALEAEARAQINAFEARYEIALSSGVDIAEHTHLPEGIAREGVDWQRPSDDYTGTVGRLADLFADAPVSGRDGQTFSAFYDDVWAHQKRRGGMPRRMPAPHMHATGEAPDGRQHLDALTAWSHAHAVLASPFGDGRPAPGVADLHARRAGHMTQLPNRNLLVLHADTLPDGTLLVDGEPVGVHEYALAQAPWRLVNDAGTIVLAAKHGGNEAAARLANVLQRAVYAPPERAVGDDAAVLDTSVFHRFDPAPAAPHALGALSADAQGVHLDGDPGTRIDVEHNVGAMLGAGARKTGFALGDDAVLVTVDHGPTASAPLEAPETIDARRAADEQLLTTEQQALQELQALGIRTVQLNGPFRSLGGIVSALVYPRGVFHTDDLANGGLPRFISPAGLRNILRLGEVLKHSGITFDVQGIFTRTGDFLVSDPGRIRHNSDYGSRQMSLSRLAEIERGVVRWLQSNETGTVLAQRDEALPPDAFMQKPSPIMRVRMRVGGVPLPDAVSMLAQQSSTLAAQLRMLDANGWRVRVGKRGGGSRIDTKHKRVTIDGALPDPESMTYVLAHETKHAVEAIEDTLGLDYSDRGRFSRTASEAEARAQINAFEARYEIKLATGIDIAATVRLPDALQREADAWQSPEDYAVAVGRLADAFADAPVSGTGGQTYTAFYGDAYDRARTRGTRAMPAPEMRATRGNADDGPHTMREIQAQRAAWSQANAARDASPFGAGDPPPLDTLSFLRDGSVLIDPVARLAIVPAETLHDGTLLGPDGQPVDPHTFTLFNPPPSDTGYTTILSARHANEGAAAQLTNLWQRAIYTVHPDAVGAAGAPSDLSGMNRYVPAAYRQPSLGELSVDRVHGDLYVVGDPARRVDPADFLGPVLGSGADKTVFDGGAGQAIGVFRDDSSNGIADAYEAVDLEQSGLAMLSDVYKLPTSTTDGPFTTANRVAVVLKPSAQVSSVDVELDIGLPRVVSRRGRADLARIRRVTQTHHLLYDFQVLFGRNGDVMLHDPGHLRPGADPDGSVLGRIDGVAAKIDDGIATGRIRLAHPAFDEAGAYAPRRGAIGRVVTTFRGIVLKLHMHALAALSPTLRAQMRLGRCDGWKVKLGTPGSGHYVDAAQRVIVLDGNTRRAGTLVFALAHEAQHSVDIATDTVGIDRSSPEAYVRSLLLAEARAQFNACRVRDEILAAGGPDIAAHVQLPQALARAAEHAFASGDPAALDALADTFGDMRTSLPGKPTYRALYTAQAHAAFAGEPLPVKLAAPARGGARRSRYAIDSAEMTRARAWLDERGMRTLTRVDGVHAPSLRALVRQTGVDTELLIARAGTVTPDAAPEFVAYARIDVNGAIKPPKFVGNTLTQDERDSLGAALDAELDAADPARAAAARRGFAFHASPVSLKELQALGGVAKIEPVRDGKPVTFTQPGRVTHRYVAAIHALDNTKHYRSAHKAIAAATESDTIYVVDQASGEIRGHASYDSSHSVWQYQGNAPLAKTRVVKRPLAGAYPRRAHVRVRPHGKSHGVPLTRARGRGVTFAVSSIAPATFERVGNRFDPIKPPKAGKPDKLPRPGLRYIGHLGLTRALNGSRRVALLTRNRAAAVLGRGRTGAALPAGGLRATDPATRLFEKNALPAGKDAALDFSGHNAVHLLSVAEFGGLEAGKHHVYVYDTTGPLTDRLDAPEGLLVPDANGKLTWHDPHNPSGPGVPLESSPIGDGPYGANVHLLLTELTPAELAAHAHGTRLAALTRRLAHLEAIERDKSPGTFASLRKWATREARDVRHARNTLKKQIKAEKDAAKRLGQPVPANPKLRIRPYQPSLVSATLVEWKRLYGNGNVSGLFAHLERIDALAKRERDPRLASLELIDTPPDAPPPAMMADAAAWRGTGMPLYVARDWSGGGARYAPVPFSKRAQRSLSTAAATDRALRRAFLGTSEALQNRVVPMSRAHRLSDDPAPFVRQIVRNGGVMPVVTIPIDPHTLNATRGAKHDPEFVGSVKSIGNQKTAKIDYWEGTITGENGNVMHLDDLTDANLHRWLDAASQAGFLLRLEMAPARALVSSEDNRHLAGTNDGYHHHARLGELLESWADANPGSPAPHVMVTFHGWDAVPEPVPGAGHLALVNSLLDRPTLKWVHVGLSYATHGADFIANQELTTALATMLVDRAQAEAAAQAAGTQPVDSALERLHGSDALTRVFERVDRATLADQHQMLLAEIERIGRAKGLQPDAIAALRQGLYEGNTTRLLNRARYATSTFATRSWAANKKTAPKEDAPARKFTETWLTSVGARLRAPGQDTTPRPGQSGAAPREPWREIVRQPALIVDDSLPVSDSRRVSAQAVAHVAPDDPLAAYAELNALRLQQVERSWSLLNWKNVLSGMVGIGAGVAVHHIGLTPTNYKQAANTTFIGVRTGRLVQALHQDTLRALQSGDPRLFNHVIDRFMSGLNNQLSAHRMHEDQRRASLLRLADEGRAKINLQLELHRRQSLPADKTVEYTKLIANDMVQQMQGVLAGTSIQQLHHGNPRRFLGKVGRTAAIAGYASLGELSLHTLLQDPSLVPFLGTTGALLGLTYTGLVQASAFTHLSIERRSRVVRFIDTASDLASIAGGYIGPFVGSAPTIHANLPMAISSLSSATLLALARTDTHFPNLTKRVTGKMPTILLLAPIGIYVGNWLYTAFGGSGKSTPPTGPTKPPGPPAGPPSGTHAHLAPAAPSQTSHTPSTSTTPSASGAPPYIVVDGDSLWVIADQHRQSLLDAAHVSRADQQAMTRGEQDTRAFNEILQLNPSVSRDPNRLSVGTPLIVG
ncbi:LWXIA domain-containing protein [Burkholderia cenocepacia]|uniref:LWXIA domain-containing protein n=1 Tax=Burkholderia cenocepacia TaxID=95486 RepID=A0A3S9NJV7_9BURK|nr:LWXIA domain-containing protein [Burkholderia cenocepacia]AZQ55867.1 LWXIA domain-containing protein [Burkholderia cenocepacia]